MKNPTDLIRTVIVVAGTLFWGAAAVGQLTVERTYCGLDRAIPIQVKLEVAGTKPELLLLEPGTARERERAAVEPGRVDLLSLFAALRRPADPKDGEERPEVTAASWEPKLFYVQLIAGGKRIGPAVVVQPMVSPVYAPRMDRSGLPMWGASSSGTAEKERARVFSGYRVYVDKDIILETSAGQLRISLRPEHAPNTCWSFRQLVEGGLYSDVLFHRVASLSGKPGADIIQTGDPNGTGQGGPGFFIDLEQSKLPHDFGVVSAARLSDPNSCGSQMFICMNREGTAYLDGRYTAFGVVLETTGAADALRAIAATPVKSDNRPVDPPVLRSAVLADAAPYGEGPKPAADPLRKPGR